MGTKEQRGGKEGWENEATGSEAEDFEAIKEAVRSRGRKQLSADDYTVAREVLYLLPDPFLTYYQAVFHAALANGTAGVGLRDDQKTEVGKASGLNTKGRTLGTRTRLTEKSGKGGSKGDGREITPEIGMQKVLSSRKGSRGSFVIHSERLLAEKDRVDRALRKLARQMRNALEESQGASGGLGIRCGQDDKGRRIRVTVKTREMVGGKVEIKTGLRPGGCWKFVEQGWAYCPWCGFKLK